MSRSVENPSAKSLSELFSRSYSAVVDSCSLILMHKGGYGRAAVDSLNLLIPCAVCRETALRDCPQGQTIDADEELIRIAIERGTALISDDKRILMRARRFNIPHLNSLTALLCLYSNHTLTEDEYKACLARLHPEARYAPWIWDYGDRAFRIIRDELLASRKGS